MTPNPEIHRGLGAPGFDSALPSEPFLYTIPAAVDATAKTVYQADFKARTLKPVLP